MMIMEELEEIHYAHITYDVHSDIVHVVREIGGDYRQVIDFPQRGEESGFGEYLEDLADASGAEIDVDHYHDQWGASRLTGEGEKEGYTIDLKGTHDQIKEFVESVGLDGYGMPSDAAIIANWWHPVRSFRGFGDVMHGIISLKAEIDEYTKDEVLEDGTRVRTVTYE